MATEDFLGTLRRTMMNKEVSLKAVFLSFVMMIFIVSGHCRLFGTGVAWLEPIGLVSACCLGPVSVFVYFAMSGYFLAGGCGREGWWKSAVLKRMKSLLLPFAIWAILYQFLQAYIWTDFSEGLRAAVSPFIENLAYGGKTVLGLDPVVRPRAEPLWFLRSLFVYVLLSPVLVAAIRRFPKLFLVGFFMFSVCCRMVALPSPISGFLWRFIDLFGLFYFAVGIALRMYAPSELKPSIRFASICGLIGLSLLATQVASKLCHFSLPTNLVPFMTPFLAVASWAIIPAIELPKFLAGIGFPIYLIHFFFLEYWWSIETKVFGAPVWTHILVWPIVFLISMLFAHIIRLALPRTAKFLFGGR